MKEVFDIALDSDFDLTLVKGDLKVKESTSQHIALILQLYAGNLWFAPKVGAGVKNYLNNSNFAGFRNILQEQLERDGIFQRKFHQNKD